MSLGFCLRVDSYVLKGGRVLDALFLCFPFLNLHDIVYCIPNVKSFDVFSELASFYLWVVKKVLNHITHQVGGGVLHIQAIIQLYQNSLTLWGIYVILSQDLLHLRVQIGFKQVLGLQRVQRVPKLMGNCGVDKLKELVLGLRLTVEYLVSNINNLYDLKLIDI